ncbi:dipeptidase [Novosphingobium aquiterrae]|uniref:Dipeptidase n=1 Tax=Novosphingobium aquiterrae TaxID=624388 RepID=A0ABV6PJU7_9SPHN
MLNRRTMIAGSLAAAAAATVEAKSRAKDDWFDRAIVIDALGGLDDPYGEESISRLSDRAISEMMATGVTMLRGTVMPVGNVADPWDEYRKSMDQFHQALAANPDRLVLIRGAAYILRAKREKKFGVMIGTQDTCMIGPALDRVAEMKKDGVLSIQLTYNNGNLAGDGALEPRDGGLTKLGKATIARIEAEKLLLDLSHGGARTMIEAAQFAKRPLVISHTGARALNDHPRNIADEVMRAVAEKGGVIGVYFMPYLTADRHPSGAALIAHIEHIARVAGDDHVGIGTDNGVLPTLLDEKSKKAMDDWTLERIKRGIAAPGEAVGVYTLVADYNTVDRYRRLAADLAKRGWSQARLEKLFGGNFLRAYKDAWGG